MVYGPSAVSYLDIRDLKRHASSGSSNSSNSIHHRPMHVGRQHGMLEVSVACKPFFQQAGGPQRRPHCQTKLRLLRVRERR